MNAKGYNAVHLDGDDIRRGLNADLGFSLQDRKENLRRVAHIAKIFNQNGIFVIASFVSPTNELRKMIRGIIDNFKLVYVKCGVAECEKRDVKGMYKQARSGNLTEFTGFSAPFEHPEDADIVVDTEIMAIEDCVKDILYKFSIKE